MLAACGHKDKDAPLAFVPADTPYVVANLEVLDDATRAGAAGPGRRADAVATGPASNAAADQLAAKDPDGARLLRALRAEFKARQSKALPRAPG